VLSASGVHAVVDAASLCFTLWDQAQILEEERLLALSMQGQGAAAQDDTFQA
jgi:hypothetical protein